MRVDRLTLIIERPNYSEVSDTYANLFVLQSVIEEFWAEELRFVDSANYNVTPGYWLRYYRMYINSVDTEIKHNHTVLASESDVKFFFLCLWSEFAASVNFE